MYVKHMCTTLQVPVALGAAVWAPEALEQQAVLLSPSGCMLTRGAGGDDLHATAYAPGEAQWLSWAAMGKAGVCCAVLRCQQPVFPAPAMHWVTWHVHINLAANLQHIPATRFTLLRLHLHADY